jgi:hypothetical protein
MIISLVVVSIQLILQFGYQLFNEQTILALYYCAVSAIAVGAIVSAYQRWLGPAPGAPLGGVGGWLLVLGAHMILGGIRAVWNGWSPVDDPDGTAGACILAFIICSLAVLLWCRVRGSLTAVRIWTAFNVAIVAVDLIQSGGTFPLHTFVTNSLWLCYLFTSRRVANTFARPKAVAAAV